MNLGLVRSIADLSNRWRSRFLPSKASSQPKHLRRGAQGETLARRFLRRNGYKILYRNFKGRSGGEIDIVCRDNDTLVFVEVKTRTREDFGDDARQYLHHLFQRLHAHLACSCKRMVKDVYQK